MDTARQHWPILQRLGTDLANRVRSFMVIGKDGDGLLVITKDGQGYWLGTIGLGGSRTTNQPTPLNVPDLVHMALGHHQIMLLNKRGQIYSMGENKCGQLGLGTVDRETYFTPQLIPSQHKFISVRCGGRHSVALTEDGKVYAWGANNFGLVGVPSSTDFLSSPRQISELDPHRIVAVECGGLHSLALTDQGEVYAWGANHLGQLGNGSETEKFSPTQIPTPILVQSMAPGARHTLLLTQTGEVYACGGNGYGQLGLPTATKSSASLVKVAGLPPISQISSQSSTNFSSAMSSDQRCFVWGHLRDGTPNSTLRELPPFYSTMESPLSFYSLHHNMPYSVSIPETPLSPLSARMSRLFDNPETSDVQFVVEQRTIHAHRIILNNSSDYFAQMFSERLLVPVVPEDPIVKVTIPDHSYQVFHALLRFLYTDSLEVFPDLICKLFDIANFYLVPELHQACLLRMRTNITLATCCLYYPLTHRHSLLPELVTFQQELVQFASTRMSEIVSTLAYQSMEPDLCNNLTNAVHVHKSGLGHH